MRANILKFSGYAAVVAGLILASDLALAEGEGLAGMADRITGSLSSVGQLILGAAMVAGIGFVLSGMVKFKAHKDNPTQVPLSAPIVLVCVGAGLIFLPSIIQTAGDTAFEDASSAGASSGVTIDGIG